MAAQVPYDVVTVTMNPAIDRTVTIHGFAAGKVNRVERCSDRAGGKGVNVAAALADYGCRVAVSGFLGKRNVGIFEQLLADKGIADRFVRIAGETRTGIKVADPVQHNTTDINFPGLPPAEDDLKRLADTLDTLASTGVPWFVLAGSLPPGVVPAFYEDGVRILKGKGARVVVDSSGEALRAALRAGPDAIKPNVAELAQLTGGRLADESDTVRAARELLDENLRMVVVSMGARGAIFVGTNEVVKVIPPEVGVISTVGAGDAMVAGFLAARLEGLDLTRTAKLAAAFAQDRLTHLDAGLSSAAAVNAWMEKMTIRRWQGDVGGANAYT